MKLLSKFMLLAVLVTASVSCSSDDDATVVLPQGDVPNLVEAAEVADLNLLLDAVGAVDGLGETLLGADAITVFAPTDEAFGAALERFEAQTLEELIAAIGGVENLQTVLGFHVVPAVAFAGDLAEGEQTFPTLAGDQEITVTRSGSEVTLTDSEGTVRNVITADVEIENGVVHVIDGVLIPELPENLPNLVEAAEAADLNLLLDAVNAVDGLGATLLGADAITVFAPTDEAFGAALERFEAQTLEELIAAIGGVENLQTVLGFHVVPAVAFAEDLAEGEQTFPTLAGDQEITVTRSGSEVTVTDSEGTVRNVITADVEIENGVVHVIDGVLIPELTEASNVVVMTVDNDGASAYFVSAITEGANVTNLNENNSTWTLTVGTRYELSVTGFGPHPFEIRDDAGNPLLSMSAEGSFEGDAGVDLQTSGAEFSFTLTQELADEIADYICTVHGSMNGDIIVQ
ncbi:fasciclin domain-containing protein [Psychroflexus sp. CAK8W]|uniref:Fasciclin domain-containing protein n=1 Tax=Psychroflexus longus TaxID=2873596 RepID=A0ABS7XF72_9FLAO|nr:fasciclin domain-containing protein [Psychroflexus longus]MBZ9777600.1 fasciclin domain-containing protein [Psychroflexus longus]